MTREPGAAELAEQLRRLKNTVMGAGHRLSLLARSGHFSPEETAGLQETARELAASAQRLERLLAAFRNRR